MGSLGIGGTGESISNASSKGFLARYCLTDKADKDSSDAPSASAFAIASVCFVIISACAFANASISAWPPVSAAAMSAAFSSEGGMTGKSDAFKSNCGSTFILLALKDLDALYNFMASLYFLAPDLPIGKSSLCGAFSSSAPKENKLDTTSFPWLRTLLTVFLICSAADGFSLWIGFPFLSTEYFPGTSTS